MPFLTTALHRSSRLVKEAIRFPCATNTQKPQVGLAALSLCLIKDPMQQRVIELNHYCVYVWNVTIKTKAIIHSECNSTLGVSLSRHWNS